MKFTPLTMSAAIGAAAILVAGAAEARDQIRIVGSSTVFPFSAAVAEQFGRSPSFKTPIVESTGSGGGMKLFCAGVGEGHPDITNASRRIKSSEYESCKSAGIETIEVKIGYDGIVLATAKSAPSLSLTKAQIFMALAKQLPVDGKLVDNPHMKWSDIDPSLPNARIEVLGPPPTSGTRDAFVELVMETACDDIDGAAEAGLEGDACARLREDGGFIEAGENDNLIVQKLEVNPKAVGIFGFSFLDQNADKIRGAAVDGVEPTFDDIASGDYGVSRSLYFYVKKNHVGVIPGIQEFVEEFASEKTWGPEGYLADKGLIPLPDAERAKAAAAATGLELLMLEGS